MGDISSTGKDVSFGSNIDYNLNFDTNALTRMHIHSDGSIGINTTAPNINATGTGPGTLTIAGSGSSITDTGYLEFNNPIGTPTAGTFGGKISFNASGNSGNKLLGAIQSSATGSGGTNGFGGQILFTTKQDNSTSVNTIIMNNLGNLGIGSAPAYKLDVNGDTNIATSYVLRFGGTQVCSSSGCTSSSDRRLKENIRPLANSLDKVLRIQGVEYDYIDKVKFSDKHQIGVIAQDVEQIYPEVVITDKQTGLKSVAYDHLIAPLIEGVKTLYKRLLSVEEQQAKQSRQIASEEQRIQRLEKENAELKARLEKLEKALETK